MHIIRKLTGKLRLFRSNILITRRLDIPLCQTSFPVQNRRYIRQVRCSLPLPGRRRRGPSPISPFPLTLIVTVTVTFAITIAVSPFPSRSATIKQVSVPFASRRPVIVVSASAITAVSIPFPIISPAGVAVFPFSSAIVSAGRV